MQPTRRLPIATDEIEEFCLRWRIRQMSLFGSVLRPDFSPSSDVDVLVALREDAAWSLWDWVQMKDDLETLLSREVDLVEESGLRNPFRRHEIMRTRQVVYAE